MRKYKALREAVKNREQIARDAIKAGKFVRSTLSEWEQFEEWMRQGSPRARMRKIESER